jgi:NADPH2:quinone reductase
MKCVEIIGAGGPDVLRLAIRPRPTPGPGEVLIRVSHAGVNRPDVLQRMGLYPPPPGASDLPGLEVSGEIVATGPDIAGRRTGERVTALMGGGGYAEFALAQAGACLPVPKGLSAAEAACIPETFFTVWANVYDDAGLKPSESLLVHGGTSGIGVTAITLAKAMGSRVIATASSAEKLEAIRALGADGAYNYASDAWDEEIAGNGGVDVALDMAGGDFVMRNLNCLKQGGRHVSIAMLRGPVGEFNIFTLMRKRLRISGSTLRSRDALEKARIARALHETVWPLFESGRLKVKVDREFPLGEAGAAHAMMEAGKHVGKIALRI